MRETVICGDAGTPAVGYRNNNPIIVPRRVELHLLPVRDTRIPKNAGSRKNKSNDLVTLRKAMPEVYPQTEYNAVRIATNAT